jgi:hypothetical protein
MGRKYESYNMVDENGEELWQTADGESIPFSQVTHQHWSNIYWYHKYVYCMSCEGQEDQNSRNIFGDFFNDTAKKCKFLMDFSLGQLEKRFDGELLDWVPIYEKEKKWFKSQSTRKILIEKFR